MGLEQLKNIFAENELNGEAICVKFANTAEDGKPYNTNYYNLDAIIAVGYHVNSKKRHNLEFGLSRLLKNISSKVCIK